MGCARAKSLIFCSTHMLCLQLEPRYGKIRSDTRHISKVWCGKYIHSDKLVSCAGFWATCSWIRSFIGVFWSAFHIFTYTFQYEKKKKKSILLITLVLQIIFHFLRLIWLNLQILHLEPSFQQNLWPSKNVLNPPYSYASTGVNLCFFSHSANMGGCGGFFITRSIFIYIRF